MKKLSNKQKLIIILVIAAIAVVLQFGFHLQLFAQILVTVVGAIVAFSMFIGMIKTIRSVNMALICLPLWLSSQR